MLHTFDKRRPIKGVQTKLYPNYRTRQQLDLNIDGSRLIWNFCVAEIKAQRQAFQLFWGLTYQQQILPPWLHHINHGHHHVDLITQLLSNLNYAKLLQARPFYRYITRIKPPQFPGLTDATVIMNQNYAINRPHRIHRLPIGIKLQLRPTLNRDALHLSKTNFNILIHQFRLVHSHTMLHRFNTGSLSWSLWRHMQRFYQKGQYQLPTAYPSQYDLSPRITKKVHTNQPAWLKQCDSNAIRQPANAITNTLNRWFKNTGGFPRFKSYRQAKQSYTTNATIKKVRGTQQIQNITIQIIDHTHIKLPKIGIVRCHYIEQPLDRLLAIEATITKSNRHYYVSLTCQYEPSQTMPPTKRMVGLDLNVENAVTTSDGQVIDTIDYNAIFSRNLLIWQRKFARQYRRALKEVQQQSAQASRLNKHDIMVRNYKTLDDYQNLQHSRRQIHRIKQHQAQVRNDRLQKLSTQLVRNYDVIVVENLVVKNMIKNHHLAKAITNQGWYLFRTMLTYKCQKFGKQLIVVNPKNTTQTCSHCGYLLTGDQKLTLSDRQWTCPQCHTHHIRDVNAAQNILKLGQQNLTKPR